MPKRVMLVSIYVLLVALFASCQMVVSSACPILDGLQDMEDSIFSQNGEDGVLLSLLQLIGVESSSFVEFGVEDGQQCNTRILRERLGFEGLLMDGGYENKDINLNREFITEENVVLLFEKYNVASSFDVLSLDVDMFDWWILLRLLRDGRYRPRIIIVETNPTLCLDETANFRKDYSQVNSVPLVVTPPWTTNQTVWDLTRYAGANPSAFAHLGSQFGYDMVYCERCGVNCFMVLRDTLPQSCRAKRPTPSSHSQGLLHVSVPLVPYPCFGSSVTGGAYPGHAIDSERRAPIKIDRTLLLDLVSRGSMNVNGSRSGGDSVMAPYHPSVDASYWSCMPNGQRWTMDWCTYSFSAFTSVPLYEQEELLTLKLNHKLQQAKQQLPQLIQKYEQIQKRILPLDGVAVTEEEYRLAVSMFHSLLTMYGSKHPLSDSVDELRSKGGIGICQSRHKSEYSCRLLAEIHYNYALTLFRIEDKGNAIPALNLLKMADYICPDCQKNTGPLMELLITLNSDNSVYCD